MKQSGNTHTSKLLTQKHTVIFDAKFQGSRRRSLFVLKFKRQRRGGLRLAARREREREREFLRTMSITGVLGAAR